MLVNDFSEDNYVLRDYKIDEVNSRNAGLLWIARASQCKEIGIREILLKDYADSDEYTDSDVLNSIEDVEAFTEKYKDTAIVDVCVRAVYKEKSFTLDIDIDKGLIGICAKRREHVDVDGLEKLFGLV